MPIMVIAASRMRVRHIFDRKLKLSSNSTTTSGRCCSIAAWNSDSSAASIASNTATSKPSVRSTVAACNVLSGGYGFIFACCFGSSCRK